MDPESYRLRLSRQRLELRATWLLLEGGIPEVKFGKSGNRKDFDLGCQWSKGEQKRWAESQRVLGLGISFQSGMCMHAHRYVGNETTWDGVKLSLVMLTTDTED